MCWTRLSYAVETAPQLDASHPMLLLLAFGALVFAPLFETLAFPLIHWMLSVFPGMWRLFMPVVAVIAH